MITIQQIKQLLYTIRYLKLRQIVYRLWYIIRKLHYRLTGFKYNLSLPSETNTIKLLPSIISYQAYYQKQFTFLNLSKQFDETIEWNYSQYGKLWTYNLTYFDFLHQPSMSKEEGIQLIYSFIDQMDSIKDGIEPFPISLRGINWIKFLIKNHITATKINDSLFAQYHILLDNLEYHLLGNHLLENAFSLLFASYYYQNEKFYIAAKKILFTELEEQILSDGGHFELSPMYHQIMLFRVLDCINLVKNNPWKKYELLPLLVEKASIMLGWLKTITYSDGSIPLLNDSANCIAPISQDLFDYACLLDIPPMILPLHASGYRTIKTPDYECILDIGNIGPDYIPGHAHSDTFNFELHINHKPLIVDTGTSTYESNPYRNSERSTSAHNTVMINGLEQSEIWGGFRVAKRAKIIHLVENGESIESIHDGYRSINTLHNRSFTFKINSIIIHDTVQSYNHSHCDSYLHFHPDISPILENNIVHAGKCTITCHGYSEIEIISYQYAPEFNKRIDAYCVKISFSNDIITTITLNEDVSDG
jgi:hypothetical protein